jgi:WD40 repeat protein
MRAFATGEELTRFPRDDGVLQEPVLSSDGRMLAAGTVINKVENGSHSSTPGCELRVFAVDTRKEIRRIRMERPPHRYAFSPNGRLLAVSERDRLFIIDVQSGGETLRRENLDAQVRSFAFSPDGGKLAVGLNNTTILVYNATAGK